MQNFKKVMNKYGIKNEKFLDRLFERFKLEKSSEKSEREEIDLQDFVIGLAVLSRLTFLDKVKCKPAPTQSSSTSLTSTKVALRLVRRLPLPRIDREHDWANREDLLQGELVGEGGQVPRSPLSYSLLFDLAHKKANRNYN
jgi:hypothetical protein